MTALILFIDNPEHASLEPALAAQLGPDAASRLLEGATARLRYLTTLFAGEKYLFYSHYPNWNDAWDINLFRKRIQSGENPGAKIQAALRDVAEESPEQILWLDSRAVAFGTGQIDTLLGALAGADLVIGRTPHGETVAMAFGPAAYGRQLPEDPGSWNAEETTLRTAEIIVPDPPKTLEDFAALDIRPE